MKKKKKYDLIIFDLDGVLVNTEEIWLKAWNQVSKEKKLPNLHNLFYEMIGCSPSHDWDLVKDKLQDEKLVQMVFEDVRKIGEQMIKKDLQAKDGVYSILSYFQEKRYLLAVATTSKRKTAKERLQTVNLYDYFDVIIGGDEVEFLKPHPEIYITVLNHLDVDPEKALAFEDSRVGVEAAYRAGIDCIMIEDLVLATESEQDRTIGIFKSFSELETNIKEKIKYEN